ncbi:MAG: O-antigen ligase family protein [Vicinamibacterales bacterium]
MGAPLVAVAGGGAGLFLLNVDLGATGLPARLPLASVGWLALAACWAPVLWLRTQPRSRPPVPTTPGASCCFATLAALALASSLWSVHPARTAVVAGVSIGAFGGAAVLTTRLGWPAVVRLASAAVGAFLLAGLVRDAVAGPLLRDPIGSFSGRHRLAGLSFSATDLGRIAAFGVLFAVLAARQRGGAPRAAHAMVAAVAVLALATSGTRLIAVSLGVLAAVLLLRRRSASGLAAAAVLAVAVLAAASRPDAVIGLIGRPGESEDHVLDLAGRTPIWGAAERAWAERPLLGHGWGANEVVLQEALYRDELRFSAYTAHNLLLGVLVDGGLVAAALLVAGLAALVRGLHGHGEAMLTLLLVVLTGTLEATFSRPALVIAVVGMLTAAATHRNEQRRPGWSRR